MSKEGDKKTCPLDKRITRSEAKERHSLRMEIDSFEPFNTASNRRLIKQESIDSYEALNEKETKRKELKDRERRRTDGFARKGGLNRKPPLFPILGGATGISLSTPRDLAVRRKSEFLTPG